MNTSHSSRPRYDTDTGQYKRHPPPRVRARVQIRAASRNLSLSFAGAGAVPLACCCSHLVQVCLLHAAAALRGLFAPFGPGPASRQTTNHSLAVHYTVYTHREPVGPPPPRPPSRSLCRGADGPVPRSRPLGHGKRSRAARALRTTHSAVRPSPFATHSAQARSRPPPPPCTSAFLPGPQRAREP